jgi:AbrB family looped-hinge helix DNA binding protein
MNTTRLSTKGQIIIPEAIRTAKAWRPGTQFEVVETPEGVLLKPALSVPKTRIEDVAGCLASKIRVKKKPVSLAQMDQAIRRKIAERRASGRY